MIIRAWLCFFFLIIITSSVMAQTPEVIDGTDDEVSVGSDIFNDFNEDIEAGQVLEDERFYRYGRLFSFLMGVGATTFTGNRGKAYSDSYPAYHVGLIHFYNFHDALAMGFEHSKHFMVIDYNPIGFQNKQVGAINVTMLRFYLGYRHYFDTTDLGTAITWSNPYVIGRFEYWWQTNEFIDDSSVRNQVGGGLGTSLGFGLEFPIVIKTSYINTEFKVHSVNFYDKYTKNYQSSQNDGKGYKDLSGYPLSFFLNYVFSW